MQLNSTNESFKILQHNKRDAVRLTLTYSMPDRGLTWVIVLHLTLKLCCIS